MFIEWKSCFSLENVRDRFLFHCNRSSHSWAWALFLHCSLFVYFASFASNAPLPLCHSQGWLKDRSALPSSAPTEGSQHPLSVQRNSKISWCSCFGVKPPKWCPIDFWLQETGGGRNEKGDHCSEIQDAWAPLPGTDQNFCVGSDGSLEPHVQLRNKTIVLTHPHTLSVPCTVTWRSQGSLAEYYGAVNDNSTRMWMSALLLLC